MRRGFTLIEMMIVVALIATLMTIVLRLSSISASNSQRNTTVIRLQRLENCLSGYYAAYGNYPPVKLHNTRDINRGADGHGIQSDDADEVELWNWKTIGDEQEQKAWNQVEAACRAQPVGAEFPFPDGQNFDEEISELSAQLAKNAADSSFKNYPQSGSRHDAFTAGFDGLQSNLGRFNSVEDCTSWRQIQLFKFGLMSFLLPRYQMMMGGNEELYTYAQWKSNNGHAPNSPLDGTAYGGDDDSSWKAIAKMVRGPDGNGKVSTGDRPELENLSADAICVRWLPNLEGICAGTRQSVTFYGVDVINESEATTSMMSLSDDPESSPPSFNIYSPDPKSPTRDQYILDSMTVLDGWGAEFFYYSPSPHQSYQLWSGGANKRTFPPWIPRAKLSSAAAECVYKWTEDDIGGMSN